MDNALLNQKIEDNKKLVHFVINRHFQQFRDDDDIFQIGLIALSKAISKYDESKGSFSNYAIRIITNSITDAIRKMQSKKRDSSNTLCLDTIESEATYVESKYDIVEFEFDMTKFLDLLTERQRKIYECLVVEGLTYRQAAPKIGCSLWVINDEVNKMREIYKKIKWEG